MTTGATKRVLTAALLALVMLPGGFACDRASEPGDRRTAASVAGGGSGITVLRVVESKQAFDGALAVEVELRNSGTGAARLSGLTGDQVFLTDQSGRRFPIHEYSVGIEKAVEIPAGQVLSVVLLFHAPGDARFVLHFGKDEVGYP